MTSTASSRSATTRHAARRWIVPLGVALAAILAFAAVLPGGHYVFDDHVLIETNADLLRPNVWWSSFGRDYYATSDRPGTSGYYRPVAVLWNAADVHLWQAKPSGLHFTNLLLHAAASVALAPALIAFGAPVAAAWITAALFAVHPVHAESVAFVSGRVDVLAALGIFVALALSASRRRFATLGLGLAALFAFLSKEASIVLPLLILMAWMARGDAAHAAEEREPSTGPAPPSGILLLTAVGAAALIALGLRYAALGAWLPASVNAPRAGHPVLLPFQTLFFGIASLYAPRSRLSLEPDPQQLSALWLASGVAIAIVLWVAAWRADRGSRSFLRRALVAGALALLPVLNLLRQETVLSERYMYLTSGFWLVPAGILLAVAWRRSRSARPIWVGVGAVLVLLLGGISAWRARAWRDDVLLWRIAVREEPQRAAFWDRLGLSLTEQQQYESAEEALRRAVELDPKYFNARLNLGVLLQRSGRPYEAIPVYREALALEPRHVNAHLNLGMAIGEMGDAPGAYEEYKLALRLKPDHPEALRLVSGTALQLGRWAEARQVLEISRRLFPNQPGLAAAFRILEQAEQQQRSPTLPGLPSGPITSPPAPTPPASTPPASQPHP